MRNSAWEEQKSILARNAVVLLLVLIFVPKVAADVSTDIKEFIQYLIWGSNPAPITNNASERDDKDVRKIIKDKNIDNEITEMKSIVSEVQRNITCILKDQESMKSNISNYDNLLKKTHNECVATLSAKFETYDEKVAELSDNINYINVSMEEMRENMILMEEEQRNINKRLDTLNSNMENLYEQFEIKINKLSNYTSDRFKEIEKGLKKHDATGDRLEKESKDNIDQIKKIEVTSYRVDIILVCIILIILIYFTNFVQRNRDIGFKSRKSGQLEGRPAVICFNPSSSEAHRKLADLFLDEYSFIIIFGYQDIPRIHSTIVFLFVDFNERNIILETYKETQQIKTETVTAISKMGGTPVVIYRQHPDSRSLGGRKLYSDKLTSIENHPILRELLEKDCVLSIDKEFTEYQQRHLKMLCKKHL